MGFDEILEDKERYPENRRDRQYPVNIGYVHESHRSSHREYANFNWVDILQKIRTNKKLRIFALMAFLLVLTMLTVLVIVLLPLILKLINSISQTGLQGILNEVTGFFDKILKGSGN